MPTNTTFNPENVTDFEKSKISFAGISLYSDCSANVTTEADLALTEDHLLTGGQLLVKGGSIHDLVSLQIVHPSLGVVNTFVDKWVVNPESVSQFNLNLNYPAKLVAGLKIRLKYQAANDVTTDRDVAVNFYLHKVLV